MENCVVVVFFIHVESQDLLFIHHSVKSDKLRI